MSDEITPSLNLLQIQPKVSLDSLPQYLGRRIVIEERHVDNNISSGDFVEYDGRFLTLMNYCMHRGSLANIEAGRTNSNQDIRREESIGYRCKMKLLAASQVASVQLLEDVLERLEVER